MGMTGSVFDVVTYPLQPLLMIFLPGRTLSFSLGLGDHIEGPRRFTLDVATIGRARNNNALHDLPVGEAFSNPRPKPRGGVQQLLRRVPRMLLPKHLRTSGGRTAQGARAPSAAGTMFFETAMSKTRGGVGR
eukprot:2306215-Pyramimonas_sp.AAC.1